MRQIIISPPLALKPYRARWVRFIEKHRHWAIYAIIMRKRTVTGYANATPHLIGVTENDRGLEVIAAETTSTDNAYYLIRGLASLLRKIDPDVIFCIHEEGIVQLCQTILWRRVWAPRAVLIYFSMKALPRTFLPKSLRPKHLIVSIYSFISWQLIRVGTDACICHTPMIEQELRREKYWKPVLTQTQYGVDVRRFKPCEQSRRRVREHLELSGCVIGFCGRFVPEKGVQDLIAAANELRGDWSLLLIGDGVLQGAISDCLAGKTYQGRVHRPGFIPHDEVADYFAAMDVFFIGSRDSPSYVDTFPLVVVQAMATALPVVGSRAGAIPFQLGRQGLLYQPGDVRALVDELQSLIDDPGKRTGYGNALRARAERQFSIDALNDSYFSFATRLIARKNKR